MSLISTPTSNDGLPIPPANRPTISWGAVFAGMFTAIAIQLTLAHLCVAIGLAMYSPFDPANQMGSIAIVTIVAWVICALIGLFAGGWVAGRLAHYYSHVTAALHGVLVWATGAVAGAGLIAAGMVLFAGAAAKLAGDGMQAAATGAAGIGSTIASVAAPSWEAVKDQMKEASSKVVSAAQDGKQETRLADQSRMMDLMGKFFTADKGARLNASDREELTTIAATQLGLSREATVKTLAQWERSWDEAVARYEAGKEVAKQKAKEAAESAKKFTASAAGVCFGLMLVGLIAACLGGNFGGMCVCREDRERAEARRNKPNAV